MAPDLHHTKLRNSIFNAVVASFEKTALEVFHFQYEHNPVYRAYAEAIGIKKEKVTQTKEIPFLPIQFFKSREVKAGNFEPQAIFESSGTTGTIPSKHFIKDLSLYEESFFRTFEQFYGNISNYCILGLLPSYLERKNSSLVYMTDQWMKKSAHPKNGFYLYDTEALYQTILMNESNEQPTILIGVSYALLDFAEKHPMALKHTLVIETGGMKGRREEMTRLSLHENLKQSFNLPNIHSEYGMTELLSQAYATQEGIFETPPWMKIMLRAEDDPFEIMGSEELNTTSVSGAVNIIDLANLYSCSFIATEDAGKLYADGKFEITGRIENSDIRGCGLMIL